VGIVALEGMEFFAYHGFYEEERKVGSRFIVDIAVTVDLSQAAQSDKLSQTVNYEVLYKIVKDEMEMPSHLLEHMAGRVVEKIYAKYPTIQSATVTIAKQNPPVGGVCRQSRITLTK
jgi:7,8-dihydroneopterin aldolase/epimerase/oxygenase